MNDSPTSTGSDTGGSASAPASAPSSAPSTPSAPSGAQGTASSFSRSVPDNVPAQGGLRDASPNEGQMFDLGPDNDFDVDLPETSPQAAPVAAVPPAEAPAQAPVQPPAQAAQPPAQPEAQPGAPQEPQSEQAPSGPVSLAELIQTSVDNHDALVDALATNVFKLTKDEVEALETNAVEAMPKVLARVYLKAQTSTMQMMSQLMPNIIQQQVFALFQQAKAEAQFKADYPELADDKYRSDIVTAAKAIRQAHPDMNNAKLIQMAGNMVMQMHNIARQARAAAPQSSPAPFQPATNGAVRVTHQQPVPVSDSDFYSIFTAPDS